MAGKWAGCGVMHRSPAIHLGWALFMATTQPLELLPSEKLERSTGSARVLLLACGALAREIVDLVEANSWQAFDIQCLPAKWHNTPELIVPALREKIRANRARYQSLYVLYGDCGTGGLLDVMLAEEGVERIGGPHCYAFFSGNERFAATADDDFSAFFLTDYLARHFDKLVWQGLGLDRHPELLADYFGNYTKIVYLAQVKDEAMEEKARAAARKLGLAYEYRFTGYGELADEMAKRS
jgi:hypothetical protein